MSDDRTFVDTSVLIYACDRSAGEKHHACRSRLAALWEARSGVLSTQILQEFYVTATRTLPRHLPPAHARAIIGRYATWPVHRIEPADILRASEIEQRDSISFRNALVVVAASRLGAGRLLTDELQPGRTIAGVQIEDPFEPQSADTPS